MAVPSRTHIIQFPVSRIKLSFTLSELEPSWTQVFAMYTRPVK